MNPLEHALVQAALTYFTGPDATGDEHVRRLTTLRDTVEALAAVRRNETRAVNYILPEQITGPVVYLGHRATGKTTAAIEWLREDAGRVLLVRDAKYAEQLAQESGLKQRQIITWRGAGGKLATRRDAQIGIDDAGSILATTLRLPTMPSLITLTGHEPTK